MGDITRTAEYLCTTRTPYVELQSVSRKISVPEIPGEKPEVTRTRLEEAARGLTKTISGCHNVRFEKLLPTAEEQAKAAAAMKDYQPFRPQDLSEFLGIKE